jgi:predicted deacylase
MNIPVIKELNLSLVGPGSVARFWVHIVSSGTAQPILVPVMVARGLKDGPILGITAAVHGNELNGLPVVQKVFQQVDVPNLRGILVGVPVVNVPGFLLNQRKFNDDQDLNRIMPGDAEGNTSEVYAHRILKKIVRHFEFLIDLHTASFGRVNSYYIRADMNHPVTSRMAQLQNADIIVNNAGKDGTLRNAAYERGIHAITVEAGDPHKLQRGMIKSALTGTLNVMSYLDMIDDPIVEPEEPGIYCSHSYWMYTTAGGVLEIGPKITDMVKQGQRIAIVRNIFGDIIREYHAPEDGIVIGRSINPVNQTGGRILHLGILPK